MPVNVKLPDYQTDPYVLKAQQELFPAGQRFLAGKAGFAMPDYQTSPYYQRGQEALSGMGEGLLTGKIPEYYRGIGEAGGPAFEEMMKMTGRDVTRGVYEDITRRGVSRGGVGTSAIAKAMGDIGVKGRWEEMMRSIEGRKSLLGAGIDVMGGTRAAGLEESQMRNLFGLDKGKLELGVRELGAEMLGGVRGGGLTSEQQQSQFGLSRAELDLEQQKFNEEMKQKEAASKNSMWGDILGAGLGMVGTIAGGPIGGAIAGKIGGMFAGGGGARGGGVVGGGGPLATYSSGGSVLGQSLRR